MRVFLYGINYRPESLGIGKYTGELASWLAERGHEVRVITAPPYYPSWRLANGYSAWRYRREEDTFRHGDGNSDVGTRGALAHGCHGIRIWRCPVLIPRKPTGRGRVLHLASFALSSLPVAIMQAFWRPDVVLVVEPPLFCAPAALMCARLSGASAWLHVQDFEVDVAFDLGLLQGAFLGKWVRVVEGWLLARFERTSSISERMVLRLRAKGVSPDRAVLFPNWVDTETITPLANESPFRTRLGLEADTQVVLFAGNMGEKHDLDVVFDAASKLQKKPEIVFVLCGEGAAYERFRQRAGGLSNVCWLPLQPGAALNDLLNLANIHLLPLHADVANSVMPSRLAGMLASARPVVATAKRGTELADIVQHCGRVVTPGDAGALTGAIEFLSSHRQEAAQLGRWGRRYAVERWDRRAVLEAFVHQLQECAGRGRHEAVDGSR